MRLASVLILAIAIVGGRAGWTADPSDPAAEARETVRDGLAYLETGFVEWRTARKCSACHHGPFLVWALDAARRQGYSVNEALLAEVKQWSLNPTSDAKVFPDPGATPKTPPDVALMLPLTSLAMVDGRSPDAPAREGVERALELLKSQQNPDGSWGFAADQGRAPILDIREVMTLWSTLAVASEPTPGESGKAAVTNALKWLAENRDTENRQALALRLLLDVRLKQPRSRIEAGREQLLAMQNPDGGWSQTPEMASDAYATGQALYVLAETGLKPGHPAVKSASSFLVRSQEAAGSWPMVSRPVRNGKDARGATYTVPIVYTGSAMATLGLARFWPAR